MGRSWPCSRGQYSSSGSWEGRGVKDGGAYRVESLGLEGERERVQAGEVSGAVGGGC